MKLIRRLFRYSIRFVLSILLFIGLYFLTAWLCTFFRSNENADNSRGEVEIFIQTNGVHTDIIMPVVCGTHDWREHFDPAQAEEADSLCPYMAIGWGDKGFYLETPTWGDLKFSTAFKALFWLGSGAMHVTWYDHRPAPSNTCKSVRLSASAFEKLCETIKKDLLLSNGSPALIDHPGYGSMDAFYESVETYNLFRTCNVWTGDKLRESGVGVAPWTPFDWGVFAGL